MYELSYSEHDNSVFPLLHARNTVETWDVDVYIMVTKHAIINFPIRSVNLDIIRTIDYDFKAR
jgi:hypothetical protein